MPNLISLACCVLLSAQPAVASSNAQTDTTKLHCFAGVDTLKPAAAKGCYNNFYKVVGKSYVLRIKIDTIPLVGSCLTVNSTGTSRRFSATLSVYNNGIKQLYNICSDVIITNAPVASKKLTSTTGQIIIGNHGIVNSYGKKTNEISILVKNIVFYDSKTNKKIEVKNELFWRVFNDLAEQG